MIFMLGSHLSLMGIIMIIGKLGCRLISRLSRKLWRVVNNGYVILDAKDLTPVDEENEVLNDQGVNVLFSALDVSEFNRVKSLTNTNDIWKNLWKFTRAHQV